MSRQRADRRAFTLIEMLIVIAVLGALAALVVPKFQNSSDDAIVATAGAQLRQIRTQVELFRARKRRDPELVVKQWTELVSGDYLQQAPENPFNGAKTIAANPAVGVGWVWRDDGTGRMDVYAVTPGGGIWAE